MGTDKALLLIDAQMNMFNEEMPVYNGEELLRIMDRLARDARAHQVPVIYLRNNGGPGDPDEPGTTGWEIHPAVAPQPGDVVIDKRRPNGFEGTNLGAELQAIGTRELIVTGMQTELCIDATCRAAAALGYDVTLVEDGHSTFDWERISAAEAITKYNAELSELVHVKPVDEIDFQ